MLRERRLWLAVSALVAVVCVATAVGAWAQGIHAWIPLTWIGLAGTAVFVAGLAAPAAIGLRDRRVAERVAEHERAVQVEADLRAAMRPLYAPAKSGPGQVGGSPATLLRADRQVVGFTGRQVELRGLASWARGTSQGVVRVVTGPGGTGKTRLAVEFAVQMEAAGWRCGLLEADRGAHAIAAIVAAREPVLLVVDYVEARADVAPMLEALAAHEGEPVIRVLLLARTLGEWWRPDGPLRRAAPIRDVLAGAEVVELGPLTISAAHHNEVFTAALEAFACHYGTPVPAATLRPVANDTPVLLLHADALTAVLDAHQGTCSDASIAATGDVVAELMGHEAKYWSQNAMANRLDQLGVGSKTRRQVVAIAGLLGSDSEHEAHGILRRLPVLAKAPALTIEQVLSWLCELYPPTSSSWLGTIQPDLLLEYLVTSVFSGSGQLADAALTGLPENRANHALVVLTRALDHYPAAALSLMRQLLMTHANLLAVPAIRMVRNVGSTALGSILAAVFEDAPMSSEVLTALADDLKRTSTPLMAATITVYLRVGEDAIAIGKMDKANQATEILNALAIALKKDGHATVAVDAQRAAAKLCRALEEAEPGRHRADLARALTGLGATLSNMGRPQDARPLHAEAVELYRAAESGEPGRREGLARAVGNLGITMSRLGREPEAKPFHTEAVELYRALEEAQPGHYKAQLAQANGCLGRTLRHLGPVQDAYAVEADAMELYRALEKAEPGRHREGLALALTDVGAILNGIGRPQEARPLHVEATALYRALEEAEPGRHGVDLAFSLACLATALTGLGKEPDAQPVFAEAVELYGAAEQAELSRHRADFAATLHNFGETLRRLGRPHDAYAVEAEAVELYRAAQQAEPGRYREGFARTLTNLSASLSVLGRQQDACVATAEVVELFRAAEQADPGRFRADLAGALAGLGASLSRLGRSEEALTVTGEAVGLYRILKDTDAAAYRGRLADTLVAWSGILLDLGRVHDAEAARREADLYSYTS